MRRKYMPAIALASLAALRGLALAAQDKYTVQVPDGIALSEVRGLETWQTVAVSHAIDLNLIEVILGNPEMVEAYQAGLPAAGKQFPDGVKMVKIHWNATKSTTAPDTTIVPGTLHDIDVMVKDSKRFPNTGGWGYAEFDYDPASETFTPFGTGSACGFECHTRVAARDYVFTSYGKR
jgi:hypothetical protein